jgi:hypothetical protein
MNINAGLLSPSSSSDNLLSGRSVLAIAGFDSFIKAALCLGKVLEGAGAAVALKFIATGKKQLSNEQIQSLGVQSTTPPKSIPEIVRSPDFANAEIILSALDGKRSRELFVEMHEVFSTSCRRPLIVSFYPGIVFRDHINGFLDRAPADLLCFNTREDFDLYHEAADALGIDASNALLTGLPIILSQNSIQRYPTSRPQIIYFDQPTVPRHKIQRDYLITELGNLARRHPEADILVKPRTRRQEVTLHHTKWHLEDLACGHILPPNMTFTHAPVKELLATASLVLTVSSTAALEAMALGIPTGIIADFGIAEHLGNHYYLGSGCFIHMKDVGLERQLRPNDEWFQRRSGIPFKTNDFLERLFDILKRHQELGHLQLRPICPSYGSEDYQIFAIEKYGKQAFIAPGLLDKDSRNFVHRFFMRLR